MSRPGQSTCNRVYDTPNIREYITLPAVGAPLAVEGHSVDFYISVIKEITEGMRQRLLDGVSEGRAALSWDDYERLTGATQNKEEHVFKRAMNLYAKRHLYKMVDRYGRYLPLSEVAELSQAS
jgi:hypothetical protein